MTEKKFVSSIIEKIGKKLRIKSDSIRVVDGHRLSYRYEILTYDNDHNPDDRNTVGYETDILIYEKISEYKWKPRVVIETKINSVTTHDAITYSQKAQAHKYVHPFLRYGILIGNREGYPLPGRLFRHGQNFDFMISWKKFSADALEMKKFIELLNDEINASRALDEILFNSRSKRREKYTTLHRPLHLSK